MNLRLVMLGAPGSGKGTQAELLAKRFNLAHVSTGDVFREAIKNQTKLGQKAKYYLEEGLLVPDNLTLDMIGDVLLDLENHKNKKGFVLDGFPRTLPQARSFEDYLAHKNLKISAVLNLKVPKEALIKRLRSRGRNDDSLDTIEKRLAVFEDLTAPLRDFYRKNSLLREVEGSKEILEVQQSLVAILK